jgi:type VI secretion system secreted protein Hcp
MNRFFSRLFAFPATRRTASRTAPPRARLQVEALDCRVLPSATPVLVGALGIPGNVQAPGVAEMIEVQGRGEKVAQAHHHGHKLLRVHEEGHKLTKIHKDKHRLTKTLVPGPQASTAAPLPESAPVAPTAAPSPPLAAPPADTLLAGQVGDAATAPPNVAGQASLPSALETLSPLKPPKFSTTGPATYTLKLEQPGAGGAVPPSPIQLISFQFGATNPSTIGSATSGAGAGKVKFNELDVTMPVSDYSPILFENLAAGIHYGTVTLTEWKNDVHGSRVAVATWTMGTVLTTSDQITGASGTSDFPTEEVHFVYGQLKESVSNNVAVWSQIRNTATFDPSSP